MDAHLRDLLYPPSNQHKDLAYRVNCDQHGLCGHPSAQLLAWRAEHVPEQSWGYHYDFAQEPQNAYGYGYDILIISFAQQSDQAAFLLTWA